MEMIEAIKARHSVRSYTTQEIDSSQVAVLEQAIAESNEQSGLSIQACWNDEQAFSSMIARFGRFKNVRNYIALLGPEGSEAEEKCGYYGQKLVLLLQTLGLNSCWVGASYNKRKAAITIEKGQKLHLVISFGYGLDQGRPSSIKPLEDFYKNESGADLPAWFVAAMEAAVLAPTAMNQRKFLMTLKPNEVKAEALRGSYTVVDLGIVKCNFEIGAAAAGADVGRDWFWAE